MEGSFSGVMNPSDRGELSGNQMVIQQYARYPAAMEPALPSASSLGSARSRVAASKSPPLQRRETPRSLQVSPTGQRSILHRESSARSGPSMSPPVFDSMRRRQSRDSMDRAESRTLPSRDITDENIDDAYVSFIFYCNPNVPSSVDTTELRKTFRSPPRSDGKSFSIFTLWELIQRFDNKELKTWIQLAIELGVEPPSLEKKQSTQKVQQYAVRLKRWMRAMHVDSFFEFCLGHPHSYYTKLPSVNALVSDSRDGVPLEEDLALRALVPQWKPKRGRKRAEDKDGDEEKPSKRPQLDTSVGVLNGGSFSTHSAAFPQSAIPFSAFPDDMESHDPWATAASSFPADAPNAQQGQDFRWRPVERDASPAGYPQSAIVPRGHHTSDVFLSAEPRSAITPSSGDKTRSRRRHGPAVSSAWPNSTGSSSGKTRGRPPNRGGVSGPFSSFPINPASTHRESSNARSSPTITLDQNSFGQFSNSQYHQSPTTNNRPGKLQLQVPQNPGAPVRLATPPTLLVNGVTSAAPKVEVHQENEPSASAHMSNVTTSLKNADTKYSPDDSSSGELVRLLCNELLHAKVIGRPAPLERGEAHSLAGTVVDKLMNSCSDPTKGNSKLFSAIHLGLGSYFGFPGTTPGTMIVNVEPAGMANAHQPSPETIYSVSHENNYGPDISTKVLYNNLRISTWSNEKPDDASRAMEESRNSIEELDDLSDTEFEVDRAENGVSDMTWKHRYMRLRTQMQKKDQALWQYRQKVMESAMKEI